ncbi:MAG: DinB family protein [Terracidiphilus sp.]|nr:DinB family protein [Terracidiphilus sp.]
MKDSGKYLLIILVATLFLPLANAQTAPRMDYAPKPPGNPSTVLLDNWNAIGRKLIAMAEDFPEDKYDFKPSPAQRSFAEQLLHAAGANYFFINPAKGVEPPSGDPKRSDYKTKAAIVEFVKRSFADGAALIKSKGDAGLNDLWVDPFSNRQVRFSEGAWGFMEHSGEHYGQLVVYYRVAGLVPPESRPKK